MISWLGVSQILIIVFCFLFSFSRLLKVTKGFFELISVFIQMDNNDIKKIAEFVAHTIRLFNHLAEKYNSMKDYGEKASASIS